MKAYVLHAVNDLRYEDTEMPVCPEGWAIIEVKSTGICSSDIPRVFSKGTYHFPTIPGHEFSGVVYNVGSVKDSAWLGKHVGCYPLIPCKECEPCKNGHYEMCAHYDYIGSRRNGALAQYVVVPIWNLIALPVDLAFEYAAMLEPLAVGLHATKMANIKKNYKVAVIGTGMIGITAAQWAKKLSQTDVYVIGRNENKRHIVESNGLKYVNQNKEPVTDDYNVLIEAVGNPSSINTAINIVKPGGTVILVGNPSGDILLPQNTYWRILRKQLIVRGTWNSAYNGINKSDWTDAIDALNDGSIKVANLITHRFCQENIMEGLLLMKEHKEAYCKVMTIWNK